MKNQDPTGSPSSSPKHGRRRADEQVIKLRAVRTEGGYKSVYSEMTRRTPGNIIRGSLRSFGEILITLGLVVMFFAAYEVWGKTAEISGHQDSLNNQIDQAWAAGGDPTLPQASASAAPGASPSAAATNAAINGIARIYIPAVRNNPWAVVEGVTQNDLRYAPGHYPDSAMPGQVGNFAVAAHRSPGLWWDLERVGDGSIIVVETRESWYVYKVYDVQIVSPNAVEVVAPVPGQPGATPTRALVTLTTCNPKFENYQRLIVHGQLERTQSKADGVPAEIGG